MDIHSHNALTETTATTTHTKPSPARVPTFSCVAWWKQVQLLIMEVDSVSAARRRRERRLRQFLRHERPSVAMALSEKKHHQVSGRPAPQPELFHLFEEEPSGSRPVSRGGQRILSGYAPRSSSPTSCPWYRFSTILCHRWWTSWLRSCTSTRRFPSRLSKRRSGHRRPSVVSLSSAAADCRADR